MRIHLEAKFVLGALLAALSAAPAVLAQSQSQTSAQASPQSAPPAKPQGQGDAASASSESSQAKPQDASSTEPQMESQEAPPPESLGEAARRARAQKSAAPAKVYTEDKVAGLSGHGVSVVGDGNRAGDSSGAENAENSEREPSSGGAPKASSQSGNSEEKMWREKAQAIRDQMAQIDARISKIQEEIQKYGAVSIDPATGARQSIIYIEDRNAQIKQLEEQKARLQTQLESLEEEGRKAGADSGWFR
jgi:chaperonin cofactor prefoldin